MLIARRTLEIPAGFSSGDTALTLTAPFDVESAFFSWSGRSGTSNAQGVASHNRGWGAWAVNPTGPVMENVCIASASRHGGGSSIAASSWASTRCVRVLDPTTKGIIGGLYVASKVWDGTTCTITFTVGTNFTVDLRLDVLLFGDGAGCQALTSASLVSGDNVIATRGQVSGALVGVGLTLSGSPASDSSFSLGMFADNEGVIEQGVLVGAADDAADTSQSIRYQYAGEALASTPTGTNGVFPRGSVTAIGVDSITVNVSEGSNRPLIMLAFFGVDARVLPVTTAANTEDDIVLTPGFAAAGGIVTSAGMGSLSGLDTASDHDLTSVGVFDSGLSQAAHGIVDVDAQPTTVVATALRVADVYVRQTIGASPALAAAMRVTSIGPTTLTARMSVAEDTPRVGHMLVLGPDTSLSLPPTSVSSAVVSTTAADVTAVDGATNEASTRFFRAPDDGVGAPDLAALEGIGVMAVVDGPGTGGVLVLRDNDAAGGPWWYGAAHRNAALQESAITWAASALTMPPAPSVAITSPVPTAGGGAVNIGAGTVLRCVAEGANYTTLQWYRGYPGLGGTLLGSGTPFNYDTTGLTEDFSLIARALNAGGDQALGAVPITFGGTPGGGGAEVLSAMQTLYLSDSDAERRRVFLSITKLGSPIPGLTGKPQLTLRDGTAGQTSASLVEVDSVANPGLYYVQLTAAEIGAEGPAVINYYDGSGNRGTTLANVEAFPPPTVGTVLGYASATSITLPTGLGIRAGWTLAVLSGAGVGQVVAISSYDSVTGAAVLESPGLVVAVDGTSKFVVWASPAGLNSAVLASAVKTRMEETGSTLAGILSDTQEIGPIVQGIQANIVESGDLPEAPDNAAITAIGTAVNALSARATELRLAKLDRDLVAVGGEMTLSDAAQAAVAGAAAAAVGSYRAKGSDASLSEAIRLLKAWTYGRASGADGDSATLVFEDPDEPGVVRLTVAVDANGNRAVSGDANLA